MVFVLWERIGSSNCTLTSVVGSISTLDGRWQTGRRFELVFSPEDAALSNFKTLEDENSPIKDKSLASKLYRRRGEWGAGWQISDSGHAQP
mmetsp:Transcript_18525/g.26886  ORF Transcript_18525/g.26886 Transcript_18525/m.26886 type:complete len:91 (-) Transcript_18525:912-1184(-)